MADVTMHIPEFPPRRLAEFLASLNGSNRRRINSGAAAQVGNFVRSYIRRIAPQNHRTAASFTPAATPTGHLEKAARNTVWRGDANGARVTVTSPGITRAFHDLEIRPVRRRALTIPARTAPEAYGRTASQVSLREPLFLIRLRNGGAMLATGNEPMGPQRPRRGTPPPRARIERPTRRDWRQPDVGGGIRPVFWLRPRARVPQKRDILPSDAALASEATKGYATAIRTLQAALGV